MKKIDKIILALDFVIVVGTMLALVGIYGFTQPLVIAPIDDLVTTNTSILFEFENGNLVLIDDNLDFSSPLELYVEDNIEVNLKPGHYYWKVQGTVGSEIRELTVQSEVDLQLRKGQNDKLEVVNSGNTILDVEVYKNGKYKETVSVDINEVVGGGNKFIGSESD